MVEWHAVVPAVAGGTGVGGVAGWKEGGFEGGANEGALGGEGDAFGEAGGAAEKGAGGVSLMDVQWRRAYKGGPGGEECKGRKGLFTE